MWELQRNFKVFWWKKKTWKQSNSEKWQNFPSCSNYIMERDIVRNLLHFTRQRCSRCRTDLGQDICNLPFSLTCFNLYIISDQSCIMKTPCNRSVCLFPPRTSWCFYWYCKEKLWVNHQVQIADQRNRHLLLSNSFISFNLNSWIGESNPW